jgi:DNA primase
MTAIDEIKSRLDIVDLVSESVQLRRSGKNYTGFCPFHANSRTPAFVVWPETGTWRCFGECNDGGDIFKFVMKKEGWDFPEALRVLAERAGVELRPPTPEEQMQVEEFERLRTLLEEAVTFYRHNLLNTEEGKIALEYLHGRGLSTETIETFGLGYAPNAWDAAANFFKDKGYNEQELIDTGLVSERESGGVYDRFRQRAIIPIRDQRGRMTGFGARTLDPEGQPKYLNSPQTELFDKGKTLFGLDRARKAIRAQDQVVIVEGYMGVFVPHQSGYENVVATMGTALTEYHLRTLKRFTRRIVLAMDSDAAGMKATLRGLEVARQTLDREGEIRFDARGLLRQEARLQADIRVTTLPKGMDPDDVVQRDPTEWERLIAEAKPVVMHVMETLAAEQDTDDPKVKQEIANQVMPLIEDIPSPIERDTYRQQLARLLKVDERTLLGSATTSRPRLQRFRSRGETHVPPARTQSPLRVNTREAYILGILIRHPDLIYHVDRGLQEEGLERLAIQDFQRTDHQVIFSLIQHSLLQDEVEPLNFVLNRLPEPMMTLTEEILLHSEKVDIQDNHVLGDLLRALINLRQQSIRQSKDHLRFLLDDAQEQDDPLISEYLKAVKLNNDMIQRLDKALNRYTNRSLY